MTIPDSATLIHQGKVRDIYDLGEDLLLVATNRVSAFDRSIATIPKKAEVLNLLSAWWFEKTNHIIDSHVLEVTASDSTRVKRCEVMPIEVVVRGYMTGTTNTSIWTLYEQGERQFFATSLPDGLSKNKPLPEPILTPTTKEADHDRPLTPETIADWINLDIWEKISHKALELFQFGQQIASQKGLILVDTKFEFGHDKNGNILLIDECLTPDSSRYWLQETYEQRLKEGLEPENFDKEFLRLWFRENCNPYEDDVLPDAPPALIKELSDRYQKIYQMLTGSVL